MLFDNVTIRLLGSHDFPAAAKQQAAADLTTAARDGALSVAVGRPLPLASAAEAHERVDAGRRERVLLSIDDWSAPSARVTTTPQPGDRPLKESSTTMPTTLDLQATTAVLVVDMQNDDLHLEGAFAATGAADHAAPQDVVRNERAVLGAPHQRSAAATSSRWGPATRPQGGGRCAGEARRRGTAPARSPASRSGRGRSSSRTGSRCTVPAARSRGPAVGPGAGSRSPPSHAGEADGQEGGRVASMCARRPERRS
jgi:hypothetical protein